MGGRPGHLPNNCTISRNFCQSQSGRLVFWEGAQSWGWAESGLYRSLAFAKCLQHWGVISFAAFSRTRCSPEHSFFGSVDLPCVCVCVLSYPAPLCAVSQIWVLRWEYPLWCSAPVYLFANWRLPFEPATNKVSLVIVVDSHHHKLETRNECSLLLHRLSLQANRCMQAPNQGA